MDHCDVFFISYDEPRADHSWAQVKGVVPRAQRMHGIKGFDAAYKACAAASRTERFFTIDGDNELLADFQQLHHDFSSYPSDAILSWSAKNIVNGQAYGNGGVKNWPKSVALAMSTHESAEQEKSAVDFCFQLNYFRMNQILSLARINGSPYQAFRAGFREGVKMCLERGKRPSFPAGADRASVLKEHVFLDNRNRLKIWCSVGMDVENGAWAIYGARLG